MLDVNRYPTNAPCVK